MMLSTGKTWARRAVLPLAVLLFADLCLDWHSASVAVAGALQVHAHASSLAGWGLLAAIVTGALIVWEVLRAIGSSLTDGRPEVLSATLAFAALVFTAIEFFSSSTSIEVAGMMDVNTGTRLWPAYVGVALAVGLAVCAAVQLLRPAETHARRLRPRPS